MVRIRLLWLSLLLCCPAAASARSSYEQLLDLYADLRAGIEIRVVDGVPDYGPDAMARRQALIRQQRVRLNAINPAQWDPAQQIDYLIVRSELDGLAFDHQVFRRWSRDPGFYTAVYLAYGPSSDHKLELPDSYPMDDETLGVFATRLRAVPRFYAMARQNLTEPVGDLARLAIRAKENELRKFAELRENLQQYHPELLKDVDAAAQAVTGYHDWLVGIADTLPPHAGIGKARYEWYLRYAQLFPYTIEELTALSARELQRARASLALVEHRYSNVPELEPAKTLEDYRALQRVRENDLKALLRNKQVLTLPEFMNEDLLEDSMTWRRRPDDRRAFWEEIDQRDPGPLRSHNLPGHTLDVRMAELDDRPVRGVMRPFEAGIRIEGWATYLEETLNKLGFRAASPHTEGLVWILLAARAVRVPAEILMHTNAFGVSEAVDYVIRETPRWMDDMVAWTDCELYLRQPGYGIGYLMGKLQIEQVLAARHAQLGRDFDLKNFHDAFLAAGIIPVVLIHWELTGDDSLVQPLWAWEPIPEAQSP